MTVRNPPSPLRSLILLALVSACQGGKGTDTGTLTDQDGDHYASDIDCDDLDATVHPEATERCDGIDNDCDGVIDGDNALDATVWFGDADGDGWGNSDIWTIACNAPEGWAAVGGDCDDDDSAAYPGATEVCDGVDNDCNGAVDEADAADATTWYIDQDGDGEGNPLGSVVACTAPDGWVEVAGDCDDGDPNTSSASPEVCDDAGKDEDCDGLVNDADPSVQGQVEVWKDADGDGHGDPAYAEHICALPDGWVEVGDDCDDTNPLRYPGSAEICGDGLDNDCDGNVDDVGVALSWYADADGDGWGDPAAPLGASCANPGGASSKPEDCDDADASISPSAAEIWYDGVDQNCDGLPDDDADGDGYAAEIAGGPDCADDNATVFPSAPEICGDTLDNDCDGVTDPCGTALSWSDDDGTDLAGTAVAWEGSAVIVGAPRADVPEPGAGAVSLLTRSGDTWSATAIWTGEAGWDGAGSAVAVLADGEIAIGAPGFEDSGAVYLLASDTGSGGLGSGRLAGVGAGDDAGSALADAGDVDGDGANDLWVGGPGANGGAGAAYLLRRAEAARGSDLSWSALTLTGVSAEDGAGSAVLGDLDLDGDGVGDALVGAPWGCGSVCSGAVYAVLSPGTGTESLSDADAVWRGTAAGDAAGRALGSLGDADGDGLDDWIVGAPEVDTGGSGAGSAWIVHGGASSGALDAVASLALLGSSPKDGLGSAVAGLGDVDGDGITDAAVGVPGWEGDTSNQGAAWIVSTSATGTETLGSSGGWLIAGTAASAAAGSTLAGGGDSDGDGVLELVVGEPGAAGVLTSVW